MKKLLLLLLVSVLCLTALIACNNDTPDNGDNNNDGGEVVIDLDSAKAYVKAFYEDASTVTAADFEVIPQAGETQMYVAFRLSDTAGLVPADNLSGKPVVMEIVPQKFAEPDGAPEAGKAKKAPAAIHYRIPAVCNVKLMSGVDVLLQSRIPIYQLGRESSTPLK